MDFSFGNSSFGNFGNDSNFDDSNVTNDTDDGGCGLNESNWHLDTEGFSRYSRPIILLYECLVFVISFSWNLFVIIFIFRHKKMLKEPPNIFFVNLAIADFLATLLCVPFYIITVGAESWTFGSNDCVRRGFCRAVGFFLSTLLLVSVYFLAAVAFDRFIAIVRNWQYERIMSVKRAWIAVIICWILALLVSSPPLYGFGTFFFEHRLGACLFRWSRNREYVLFFVIQLLIPIIIITVCTLATYCRVRKFLIKQHQRTIRHITRKATVVGFEMKHKKRQKKVLWIFTTLLVVLTLCWAPGIGTAIVGFFVGYEDIPGPVFVVDLMFVLSNIMLNPIVHAFFRKSIRKSIKNFLYTILEKMMSCFMIGKGKDFRENVTSYLRDNRSDGAHGNNSTNSSDSNTTSDPTLLSYAPAPSTECLDDSGGQETTAGVSPAPTIDSTTATKYPHSKIKRKVSIIELQQMEEDAEAKNEEHDNEHCEEPGNFRRESHFIEDGEEQTISKDDGISGTFQHIL